MSNFYWENVMVSGNPSRISADIPKKTVFKSHYDTILLRDVYKKYIQVLNHKKEDGSAGLSFPVQRRMFSPFSFNSQLSMQVPFEECYINDMYDPYAVLMMVLRDFKIDLITSVDGYQINLEKDYFRIRNRFNDKYLHMMRLASEQKFCSEDDLIQLASLFYLLTVSADMTCGLDIGGDGTFRNNWSMKPCTVVLNEKDWINASYKLKNSCFSGLHWRNFFFRYASQSGEDDLWVWNMPPIGDKFYSQSRSDMFLEVVKDMIPILSKRGSKVLMTCELNEEQFKQFYQIFDLKYEHQFYKSKDFILNIQEHVNYKLLIIRNYNNLGNIINPKGKDIEYGYYQDFEEEFQEELE